MIPNGSRLVVASFLAAVLFAAFALIGCETPPTQGPRSAPAASERPAPPRPGSAPIASWHDRTLTWDDVRAPLIEIAGVTALRDAFLDQRIEQALAEKEISVDQAAIEQERTYLLQALDPSADVAERLLERIRLQQGLGPTRFAALLRRNAGLRALVQGDVKVTSDAIARQHEILHGPKRVARLIALQSLHDAESVHRELDTGTSFADAATRHSTDASAQRGGLLSPIGKRDPTWPQAFRDALYALSPGQVSPPTAIDNQYVLIQMIEERPADGVTLDSARGEAETSLRRAQERVLMEERARTYLAEIRPTIMDTGLDQAWRRASP